MPCAEEGQRLGSNHKAMSLIDELYESPVQTSCFAYSEDTESCTACNELLCAELGKKCPFFKSKTRLKKENSKTAVTLLRKMQQDDGLRRNLKLLGITESGLRNKVEQKGGSHEKQVDSTAKRNG